MIDGPAAALAAERAEERFQKIFGLVPLPIIITRDAGGPLVDVNEAFLRLTGCAREEVIGKTTEQIGLRTPHRARNIEKIRQEGRLRDAEAQLQLESGEVLDVILSGEMIELDGQTCALGIVQDVTGERRILDALRASEAEARARAEELLALLDAAPAAIWIAHDRACREVTGSRVAYETLRVRPGANISKTGPDPKVLQHIRVLQNGQEIPNEELPLQRAAQEGVEIRDFEEEVLYDDGTRMWMYGNARPLLDESGAPRGAIAAFVDVTRMKAAEQALRDADRRKDEFLAMLSHELRNPLAPIRNAVRLLQRGEGAAKAIEIIDRQTAHLHRLIDDLLDVARVTQGKIALHRERVELLNVVGQALEISRPLIEAKRHELSVSLPDQPVQLDGDLARLAQALSNLLNNAAKYTDPCGHIALKAVRRGDELEISVSDDGMGISAEDLPRMFELFAQSQRGIDRAQGGLGVGLTLVRKIAELHGGRASAKSGGPGMGSEFTIVIPALRQVSNPSPPPEPRAAAKGARGRRVLVVDDNVDSAETVAMLLGTDGHLTRLAHDGEAALLAAREFVPELIVLDLGLPGMSGYDVARKLRSEPGMAEVTLVALTGYGREEDRARSRDAGFEYHLTKPVEYEELGALVRRLRD